MGTYREKKSNSLRAEPCGTSYSGGTIDDFSKSILIIVLHLELNLIYFHEYETLRKDNGLIRSTITQFFAAGLVKTGRHAGKSSLFLVSLLCCTSENKLTIYPESFAGGLTGWQKEEQFLKQNKMLRSGRQRL